MSSANPPPIQEQIFSLSELARRAGRPADYEAEAGALTALARQLARKPQALLQRLVEIAADLCKAGSVGVSALELCAEGERFRWIAVAGRYAAYEGRISPRRFSLSGTCLDRGELLLCSHPERLFPSLQDAAPPIVESLILPIMAAGRPLGTLWLLSHEEKQRFDREDARLMTSLADFAAAALQMRSETLKAGRRRRASGAVDNARLYEAAQMEIAERQRAEKALQESRDYYRTLTEALPQLIWTTGPDGVPDYFNRNWLDYTGQTPDGATSWWKGGVHPEDLDQTMARWSMAVQSGEPYEAEYRLKRADGEYHWFLARGVPLKNEQGAIVKWFGACTLIEDQKRAEQTQRFLAELSAKIRPPTDPGEILWTVVNTLGPHLQVTHCTYADIDVDKNLFFTHRDYHWKRAPQPGVHPLDLFGTEIVTAMKAGRTVVVRDVQTDPFIGHLAATVFHPADIRAFVLVPLIKEGRWTAVLSVTMHGEPRNWTSEEVRLLEKVMEQTWLAVENVRLYQAEKERREQLALAVSEVHHRVKNNLQAVGALLEMQLPEKGNTIPVEAVLDSLSQIRTIALVHDMLSRDSPIGSVDAGRVLTKLVGLLSQSMRAGDKPLALTVKAETMWLPTQKATALALIANELLTNAAKHSDSEPPSSISLRLYREEAVAHLVVEDGGPGFPCDFDPIQNANVGLQLVQTLARHDLQGTVRFINRNAAEAGADQRGARAEITFSLTD